MKTKERAASSGGARVAKSPRLEHHDITLGVGGSILIESAGERLRIKEIKAGKITFEQEPLEEQG